MLRLLPLLLLFALPQSADAVLTPISQTRQVSGSGEVADNFGGESFDDSHSASAPDFLAFQEGASVNVGPDQGLGSGGGTQDSSLDAFAMVATGSAFANAESYEFDWYASADGLSEFDVTFELTEEVDYTLTGMTAAYDNGQVVVELRTGAGAIVFSTGGGGEIPFQASGTLASGLYELQARADGSCFASDFEFDYAFAEYDVTFTVGVTTSSPVPATFAWRVGPNPVLAATTVSWTQASAGPIRIDVLDVRGRRVRRWEPNSAESGSVRWDGRDHRGARVPAGTYFLRLTAGDHREQRKVVVLR